MKRKIKKKPIIILILVVVALIFGIIYLVKTINYHKTYDYKLGEIGYTKEEITNLKKLDNTSLDYLLTISYSKQIPILVNEKYFMEKNLKKYINYLDKNSNLTDVVAIINVGSNNEWYSNTTKTDLTKGHSLLTNKFYYLDNSYNTENMVSVSKQYSYGENQMVTSETYNAFLEMFKAAKDQDLTLIINSSYRSYEDQEEIYNDFKNSRGIEYADKIAARAGYSEHQTGLAIDIMNNKELYIDEKDTKKEYEWLINNSYKYGYILRYPKEKEHITGYIFEDWHFRYFGERLATELYNSKLTYEEYLAKK